MRLADGAVSDCRDSGARGAGAGTGACASRAVECQHVVARRAGTGGRTRGQHGVLGAGSRHVCVARAVGTARRYGWTAHAADTARRHGSTAPRWTVGGGHQWQQGE